VKHQNRCCDLHPMDDIKTNLMAKSRQIRQLLLDAAVTLAHKLA
jgi:hypothetical protein